METIPHDQVLAELGVTVQDVRKVVAHSMLARAGVIWGDRPSRLVGEPVQLEEIREVTWDLDGYQMAARQATHSLAQAGWTFATKLAEGTAIMYAESGWFLKAWHLNVEHEADGKITRSDQGQMHVLSADLGWPQINVLADQWVDMDAAEVADFVGSLFEQHPDLAKPVKAAEVARGMYEDRGWQPWVAFLNGSYKQHLGFGSLGVGNYLADFEFHLGPSYLKIK